MSAGRFIKWLRVISTGLLLTGFDVLAQPVQRPNILMIVADDADWNSFGAFGCSIADITPHIDRLADQGVRFMHAYSTVAVCTPVRATMHTGLLPHRSGCEGFEPIRSEVTTLNERLHDAGYFISMFGKNGAYKPREKYCVDLDWPAGRGNRNPARVHDFILESIREAREAGKPFFAHFNCADPHRPFYGSPEDDALILKHPDKHGVPSRIIEPHEVKVPAYLEDLPAIRKELAQYFTCIRRLDDAVGAAMQALEDAGEGDNTIVLFYGGDQGASFPFSKSNAYMHSNRGALVFRWPGVAGGRVIKEQMVSTLDFTPTLLEAAGLDPINGMDGHSFVGLLKGKPQEGRDAVFCYYYRTAADRHFPMRVIRTTRDAYLWNVWSDGARSYQSEGMSGLTWKAMRASAKEQPSLEERCRYYLFRAPEEYYDTANDPGERHNLMDDPVHQARIKSLQDRLQAHLDQTGDPLAEAFTRRRDPAFMRAAMAKLEAEK